VSMCVLLFVLLKGDRVSITGFGYFGKKQPYSNIFYIFPVNIIILKINIKFINLFDLIYHS
jgi:hypothetical protein